MIGYTRWLTSRQHRQGLYRVVVVALSIGVLAWHLSPLVSGRAVAGWDLTPHYYVYLRFLALLSEGRLWGYDPMWSAGYPEFTLYAPLAYLYLGALHLLSCGAVPEQWSFNLGLFFLPFIFLRSVFFAVRGFFGRGAAFCSIPLAAAFLCVGREYYMLGYNINGLLAGGLIPAFCGLCVLGYFLGFIGSDWRRHSRLGIVRVALSYALVLLVHLLSFVFASFVLAVLLFFRRYRVRALAAGCLAAALTGWWVRRFLTHAALQSGEVLGLSGIAPDPLLGIFPGLAGVEDIWLRVPYLVIALLLLILTCSGWYGLAARRHFFIPLMFAAVLLLLPRGLLPALIDAPLHYYRFMQPLALVGLMLASVGAWKIWLRVRLVRKEMLRAMLRGPALAALPCLVALAGGLFRVEDKFLLQDRSLARTPYRLHQESYPEFGAAWRMLAYIKSLKPEGRIAVEGPTSAFARLGSPHFFLSMLPRFAHTPVVNGLLAESSPSSPFLAAALGVGSRHMVWGRHTLLAQPDFFSQPLSSMLTRLGKFNVQYVLASSDGYARALDREPYDTLYLDKQIGWFKLYRLASFAARAEVSSYRPFAFVDGGGVPFRVFAEQWYKDIRLLDRPVISTTIKMLTGGDGLSARIGGVIISAGDAALPRGDYEQLLGLGKPLIFLDGGPAEVAAADAERVSVIPTFSQREGWPALFGELQALESAPPAWTALPLLEESGRRLRFRGEGTVRLSYSYSPGWVSAGAVSPVNQINTN